MSKVITNNLINLQNETTALNIINGNDTLLAAAFDNTLSRDGTAPNQMLSNLDMNSNQILNLPVPASDTSPARKIDLTNVSQVTNLIHTASATSITIGTGAKTFTVPSGLGFFPGQYLLIQVTGDTTKYMLGRVTSYAATTLVMNILSTAGSGTFSTWTIDISGPVGAPVATLNTVVNAIAATIDPSINTLTFAGYNSIGDGGTGTYLRVGSQPADTGKFQSADGSWWHLVSNVVSPEMFGCFGDGTTDDRANMQNCFGFVTNRGGGEVRFTANKNYRIAINTGVTDKGLILSNGILLILNGSKISLECTGFVYGVRPLNNWRIYGPGIIATTVSVGLPGAPGGSGDQAIWHAPLGLGCAYGEGGSVASPSPYHEISDWIVQGVTFTSVRNNGQGGLIIGFGGMHHGAIRDCVFPDNATIALPIDFDWGFYGSVDSTNGATLTATAVRYNAGTTYTVHPHQIIIENNFIGNMSMPYYTTPSTFGSHGIRMSGCYDMKVLNNDIGSVTYVGIFITGGDVGWEFSQGPIRHCAMQDIIVKGNNIRNSPHLGIYIDAFPDNVYSAFKLGTYSPFYIVDGYNNNMLISGNRISTTATSDSPGIQISSTKGGTIEDNAIFFFDRGIYVLGLSTNISILRNDITFCNNAGIKIDDTTTINGLFNTLIQHNNVYRNCTSSSTEGNISIGSAQNTIVDSNYIGFGEDQSLYGLVVGNQTSAIYTTVTNNVVQEVKTGGCAYKILETNGIFTIWVFRDNRYVGGTNTYLQGPAILPVRREYSIAEPGILITHAEGQRSASTGDTTPTIGIWGVGSTIYNVDAINTGEGVLSKCTVTGSPGTWKRLITAP